MQRAEPGWLGQLCASSLNKPVFIQIPKVWLCPWENGGCPERKANDFLPSQSDGGGGGTHRGSPTPLYWTVEAEWRSHKVSEGAAAIRSSKLHVLFQIQCWCLNSNFCIITKLHQSAYICQVIRFQPLWEYNLITNNNNKKN